MNNEDRVPAGLLAAYYRGEDGVHAGRIVKLFIHKRVCLFNLIENGIQLKCTIKDDETERYPNLVQSLKIGSLICGTAHPVLRHDGETEFHFNVLYHVAENRLGSIETGLAKDSRLSVVDLKRNYHISICSDSISAANIYARSAILNSLRQMLAAKGYFECTTPVLGKNYYGGGARGFTTHMLDSGADMFLRITSEIALKHYIGGSFNRVYETGYSFRNGSVSAKYSTPFYAAEIYTAYISEEENNRLALSLIRTIEKSLKSVLQLFNLEPVVSFEGAIPTVPFDKYYEMKTGNIFDWKTLREKNLDGSAYCRSLYKTFKKEWISDQTGPVFITDLPSGNSPLIQEKGNGALYRSYLIANGATLVECAIGKTDPSELEEALNRQDNEQHVRYPKDYRSFIHAYRLGMPPVGSIFLGVDRIFPALVGIDNINSLLMTM